MSQSLSFGILKYTIILINILLFSQSELEPRSKMMVLSCSKLLNQQYKEKSKPDNYSKILLSCFITISQSQAEKIFSTKEKDYTPINSEEIDELLDLKNLDKYSEEEIKSKSDLMNRFIQENENPNPRRLVQDNADNEANKDKIENEVIKDGDTKDDNEDKDDDDDETNDFDYDPNYYGDDMNDSENMYGRDYDDYYDDYYGDYYGYGNYNDYNYSDEDYSNMYGNDNQYYSDDDKPFKVLIQENKGMVIFICCLVVMIILIAIFGKDFEETQTLEVDPNKNKNE